MAGRTITPLIHRRPVGVYWHWQSQVTDGYGLFATFSQQVVRKLGGIHAVFANSPGCSGGNVFVSITLPDPLRRGTNGLVGQDVSGLALFVTILMQEARCFQRDIYRRKKRLISTETDVGGVYRHRVN